MSKLKAPFPWFGGKSRVADLVWSRFGNVKNYVEPFFGSGAVLLGRPEVGAIETVNDLDGFVANMWRAVACDPEGVAFYASDPVNEIDLISRHIWLVRQRGDMTSRLSADPLYFDAKIAGWWVWGLCSWIGSGWCTGTGCWTEVDGQLVRSETRNGVTSQLPSIGNGGRGVHRKLPSIGDAGKGVNRQLPHLGTSGQGVVANREHLAETLSELRDRLVRVRVCCGDWSRVLGPSVTTHNGLTGVLLDPPYADTAKRSEKLYAVDSTSVAHDVREWAIAHGNDEKMRIALCGYEGEHVMPDSWECVPWKAVGGYGSQNAAGNDNAKKERVWFSPGCLRP